LISANDGKDRLRRPMGAAAGPTRSARFLKSAREGSDAARQNSDETPVFDKIASICTEKYRSRVSVSLNIVHAQVAGVSR
jgi:hypothetical protein